MIPWVNQNEDPGFTYANSPRDRFVSLRSHPSVTQGQRLAQVPHGAAVTIFTCEDAESQVEGVSVHWCQAEYNGVRGFMFDGYLSYDCPSCG